MATIRIAQRELDRINGEILQLRNQEQDIVPLDEEHYGWVLNEKYKVPREGQYKYEAWLQLFRLKQALGRLPRFRKELRHLSTEQIVHLGLQTISTFQDEFRSQGKYRQGSPFFSTRYERAFLRSLNSVISEHTSGGWLKVFGGHNHLPLGRYVGDILVVGLLPSPEEIEAYMAKGHSGRFYGTLFEVGGEGVHSKKSVKDECMRAVYNAAGFHVVDIDKVLYDRTQQLRDP